jgi:hypothetical protein
MILKLCLFALAASAIAPAASAQQPRELRPRTQILQPVDLAEPPGPVQRAARAFGACVRQEMRGLAPNMTDEEAAARLMRGCAARFEEVARAADQVIAAARWTDAHKSRARADLRARLELARERLAATVRQRRPIFASGSTR